MARAWSPMWGRWRWLFPRADGDGTPPRQIERAFRERRPGVVSAENFPRKIRSGGIEKSALRGGRETDKISFVLRGGDYMEHCYLLVYSYWKGHEKGIGNVCKALINQETQRSIPIRGIEDIRFLEAGLCQDNDFDLVVITNFVKF